MTLPRVLDIETLRSAYAQRRLTPAMLAEEIIERRASARDPAIFISTVPDEALRAAARQLMEAHPEPNSLPLWGIPFAAKDNIDAAGLPTTAACPAFAYVPDADAAVVARLKGAGALLIGKTNLDQFATGLNGTRSPYGSPRSVFDPRYVSGGSSSGSAVAVASGLASFALGTDTAGSGRVPAMFNNLVGIKPTVGLVPNSGVVPACRTLDCVSIFALTASDGNEVRCVVEGPDAADPFSRSGAPVPLPRTGMRLGVPSAAEQEFHGDSGMAALYDRAMRAAEDLGFTLVEIDYAPFRQAAALLYDGPWVAERLAAVRGFFESHADDFDPSVRAIVSNAGRFSAVDAFEGRYALAALKARTQAEWDRCDLLLLPTAPTTYTVEEMLADPVCLNSRLGHYTNFVNLLDCAAVAVPSGFGTRGHLPGGVTLVGPAFCDEALAWVADRLHRRLAEGMGVDRSAMLPSPASTIADAADTGIPERDEAIEIAVVGAHLSGMPLNSQLTSRGGVLRRDARTAPGYRLYALPGPTPRKPGLVRDPTIAGPGIEVEIWALSPAAFGSFVAAIPAPLGIGRLSLGDGTDVAGFLCEPYAVAHAREITNIGGWRAFMEGEAGSGT